MRRNTSPALKRVCSRSKDNGLLAGLPADRLQGHPDGRKYHDVDSSVLAFETRRAPPSRSCVKRALPSCSSRSWPSRS
ncbi:hypothetical protein [Caulobacter sp. B11]|uniref:hypothetical protein n=1 Tax=Caulobacter sp. B11 TaxID=2048899 RepID=UPI003513C4F8